MCKKVNYKDCNVRIDSCMRNLISALASSKYKTLACCCGHNKYPVTIIVEFGDVGIFELMTGKYIPRKKKFYKKDSEGHYYIPEIL